MFCVCVVAGRQSGSTGGFVVPKHRFSYDAMFMTGRYSTGKCSVTGSVFPGSHPRTTLAVKQDVDSFVRKSDCDGDIRRCECDTLEPLLSFG